MVLHYVLKIYVSYFIWDPRTQENNNILQVFAFKFLTVHKEIDHYLFDGFQAFLRYLSRHRCTYTVHAQLQLKAANTLFK